MLTLIDLASVANLPEARRLMREIATAAPLSPAVLSRMAERWERLGGASLLSELVAMVREQDNPDSSAIQQIGRIRPCNGTWMARGQAPKNG